MNAILSFTTIENRITLSKSMIELLQNPSKNPKKASTIEILQKIHEQCYGHKDLEKTWKRSLALGCCLGYSMEKLSIQTDEVWSKEERIAIFQLLDTLGVKLLENKTKELHHQLLYVRTQLLGTSLEGNTFQGSASNQMVDQLKTAGKTKAIFSTWKEGSGHSFAVDIDKRTIYDGITQSYATEKEFKNAISVKIGSNKAHLYSNSISNKLQGEKSAETHDPFLAVIIMGIVVGAFFLVFFGICVYCIQTGAY